MGIISISKDGNSSGDQLLNNVDVVNTMKRVLSVLTLKNRLDGKFYVYFITVLKEAVYFSWISFICCKLY